MWIKKGDYMNKTKLSILCVVSFFLLVIMLSLTIHSEQSTENKNYNYIQESTTNDKFESPVIHNTLSEIESSINL